MDAKAEPVKTDSCHVSHCVHDCRKSVPPEAFGRPHSPQISSVPCCRRELWIPCFQWLGLLLVAVMLPRVHLLWEWLRTTETEALLDLRSTLPAQWRLYYKWWLCQQHLPRQLMHQLNRAGVRLHISLRVRYIYCILWWHWSIFHISKTHTHIWEAFEHYSSCWHVLYMHVQ